MASTSSYVPDGWDDDDLMRGLMSTFKKREVNPDDYDAKIKFWAHAIEESSFSALDPIISENILSRRFRRKDRIPAGLETVLRDMWSGGSIQTLDEYGSGSQGWLSWSVGMLARPVSWVFGYGQTSQISDCEFVIPAVVKDQATQVLERHDRWKDDEESPVSSSGVIGYSALRKLVRDICPSEVSFDLAIIQLQRDQLITTGTSRNGEKIIKFRESENSEPAKLTETDTSLHNLQKTMEKLQKEMEKMDEAIQRYDKEARLCLRQGNKMKAKQLLRQKLLVLKKVKEKDDAYSNMLSLMHKLAQTKEQRQILDAYKSGVSAFRRNLDAHGLSPEKVDETMDDIQEALSDQQDIALALAQGPSLDGGDRDAELENELDELLKEEESIEPTIGKREYLLFETSSCPVRHIVLDSAAKSFSRGHGPPRMQFGSEIRLPDVPPQVEESNITPRSPDRLKRLRLELERH